VKNTCLSACYDFIDEVFAPHLYNSSGLPPLGAPVLIAEKRKPFFFFYTISLMPDKRQPPLNYRLFLYN